MNEVISTDINVSGIFKVESSTDGDNWKLEIEDKNLVVNNAATLLRDVMNGESSKIVSKIQLGDNNGNPTINDPLKTDVRLARVVFEKTAVRTPTTYQGKPAIQYIINLGTSEGNGSGRVSYNEYGLVNAENTLFSRKTKAVINKDSSVALRFTWFLIFN